jgi:hypothetical protein
MSDCILSKELEENMIRLKSNVLSEVSTPTLAAIYAKIIDGFVPFCQQNVKGTLTPQEAIAQYYKHVTNEEPYSKPKTEHLKRMARAIFIIRDTIESRPPLRKYIYGILEIPSMFTEDMRSYENWLTENNFAHGTVITRVNRIKQFLLGINSAVDQGLASLTPDILVNYISGLNGRYSSLGKSNILYTIRNFFTSPHIKSQLTFDTSPFLTNLHTNKHERIRSCYTPEEIRCVMNVVDRSTAKGKMHYLMMLLAGLYGLRACDIRTMKLANVDWTHRLIKINQYKTKRYLELPLIFLPSAASRPSITKRCATPDTKPFDTLYADFIRSYVHSEFSGNIVQFQQYLCMCIRLCNSFRSLSVNAT